MHVVTKRGGSLEPRSEETKGKETTATNSDPPDRPQAAFGSGAEPAEAPRPIAGPVSGEQDRLLAEFAQRLGRIQERARRSHRSDVAQDIVQRAAELLVKEIRAKGGRLGAPLDAAFGRHRLNERIKQTEAVSRREGREEALIEDTEDAADGVVRAQARLPDFVPARDEELDLGIFFKRLRKTMRGCSELKETAAELYRYTLALKDSSGSLAALYCGGRGWTPARYVAHARTHARSALLRLAWIDPTLIRLLIRTREREGRRALVSDVDYERFLSTRTRKGNSVQIQSLMRTWGCSKDAAERERARLEDLIMRLLADVETRRRP